MSKKFILTIDYELHLGNETGSVSECMIEPTRKLMNMLNTNGSKMTVFWDILHYYKLLELKERFLQLKEECELIERQIEELYVNGHDIQLHIHPHWLDAEYVNNKWIFGYSRFSLKDLKSGGEKDDMNTLYGCISQSKVLLENYMHKFAPEYEVTTFRAGGYLIEPFRQVKEVFKENNIKIDSSVCPEMKMEVVPFRFDYRGYPSTRYQCFDDLKTDNILGDFIEYPVTTISIPFLYKIYFRFLFRLKYIKFSSELKGTGSCNSVGKTKQDYSRRIWNLFFKKEVCQLTIDSSFREKFAYIVEKSTDDSVMILHPKFLNSHTCQLLSYMLTNNKLEFTSIRENETRLSLLYK